MVRHEPTTRAAPPDASGEPPATGSGRRATPSGVRPVEGRVGRYELCFYLAAGGMATVYLARLEGPDGFEKLVALKTIHPHLADDPRFVEMFLDEARIASRISHSNVCQTFDYGEADGTWFIAMEFLVGECFATVYNRLLQRPDLRSSSRSRATLLAMLAQACEGLHAAHELVDARGQPLGVVHRDVSHHNVFVTYDGAVKVVDFGIATAADRLHRTATGEVKGKYAYMAPEQARGRKVDRTADVWAIGVMAWELLTGRRLFGRRSEAETVLALTTAEIVPPSRFDGSISPALDAVVLRALARTPSERWPTARELGLALVAASGEPRGAVGGPEIAALMSELFPEGRAARDALADRARRPTGALEPLPEDLATTLVALAPALGSEPTPATEIRETSPSGDVDDLAAPLESDVRARSPAPRPSGLRRVWALAGLVLAAVVGVALASSIDVPRSPSATVSLAPTPVAEVPPTPRSEPPTPRSEPPTPRSEPPPSEPPPSEPPPSEPPGSEPPSSDSPSRERASEEPPAPRGPSPSRRPGVLNAVSPGTWAEVRAGSRACETPCQISLPSGRHRVRVTVEGRGAPRAYEVTIRPGETTRLVIPR